MIVLRCGVSLSQLVALRIAGPGSVHRLSPCFAIAQFRSFSFTSNPCSSFQRLRSLFDHHKCSYSLLGKRFLSVSTVRLMKTTQRCRTRDEGEGSNTRKSILEQRHKSVLYYLCAVAVLVAGASYAAVPLYRIFCQSYSYGGTVATHSADKDLSKMKKVKDRELTIKFNADKSSSLQWSFVPRQTEIILYPGETALAFYTAKNSTNRPIDGISTYNVIPYEVGQYFNKIQCFCFEEQRLNPGETVELPVFFYIDPEFSNDPKMEDVDTILLSYTFFEAKEVPQINLPSLSSLKLSS